MATLEQIQAKMKHLQVQAEALLAKKAQAAVDQIRDIMLKHGLTTEDIEAKTKARRQGKNTVAPVANVKTKAAVARKGGLPAKYRDPKTGATWSGHARPPAWIKDVKDRSKFLIAGAGAPDSASVAGKSKVVAEPASQAATKSKLPPKYRDPKTGATWSGHARPPRWIADAKDRTKFLIAGVDAVADADVASNTKSVAKKVAAKKVAAEKVAAKKVTVKKVTSKKVVVKKAAAKKTVSARTPVTRKAPAKKATAKKAVQAASKTA
ncbi:H-NS histone family protein [Paraburkholderia sp. GAS334]|uniref:H-NS histone family protein n=1 Tax=Paraburkholderia sp. GAS334 TaxID=3035131 RepID=UPI003D1E1FA2